MRKIILLLAIGLVLFSTVAAQNKETLSRKERKKEKKEAKAKEVASLIDNKNFIFTAQQAIPMSGPSINLTSDYNLILAVDSAKAFLPYYGVAYQAEYMEKDGGIKFNEPMSNYKLDLKKGLYNISFTANSPKDQYNCVLSISKSGYATVHISCNKRQAIQYSGSIEKPEN